MDNPSCVFCNCLICECTILSLKEKLSNVTEERDAVLTNCPYPWCRECEVECRSVDEDGLCNSCGTEPIMPTSQTVAENDRMKRGYKEINIALGMDEKHDFYGLTPIDCINAMKESIENLKRQLAEK